MGVFLSFVRWGLPQSKLLFSSALFFSLTSFLGLKWPTNHRYLKTLEWLKWSHATKTQGGPLTQTFLKPRYISWIITSFSSLQKREWWPRLFHRCSVAKLWRFSSFQVFRTISRWYFKDIAVPMKRLSTPWLDLLNISLWKSVN